MFAHRPVSVQAVSVTGTYEMVSLIAAERRQIVTTTAEVALRVDETASLKLRLAQAMRTSVRSSVLTEH